MLITPTFARIFEGSTKIFLAQKEKIQISEIHLIVKNYLAPEAHIKIVKNGFNTINDYQDNRVSFTYAQCEDNSVFI